MIVPGKLQCSWNSRLTRRSKITNAFGRNYPKIDWVQGMYSVVYALQYWNIVVSVTQQIESSTYIKNLTATHEVRKMPIPYSISNYVCLVA